MILGMSLPVFTALHVVISLVGIGSGVVVLYGLTASKRLDGWTMLFLVTTIATSLTGFLFPNSHITPGIVIGILSLVVLASAIAARYGFHLTGAWRPIYVVCASLGLYFNCFVLVVQSFEKVPALRAAAPTQKEPPFVAAQLVVLAAFIMATVLAVKRFHPESTLGSSLSASSNKRAA
jgi:hypothetical protein